MTENYRKVKQVLWTILVVNLLVAAVKIVVGLMIKSASMTADGFHSITDGSSNLVGLLGIHFASQPVDRDHPYGHSKFEMLAGLVIAGMLLVMGGKIVIDAVGRFVRPVVPEITLESMLLLLFTLCVNLIVTRYEHKKGVEFNSQILISDSQHTKSDLYISLGVLLTLVCVKAGLPPVIDPVVSLIVAGFIIFAAYEILRDNGGILLDKAVVDPKEIVRIVLSFEKVKDVHKIRSRGSMYDMHIDMHIVTEHDLSVEECHELMHAIEDKIGSVFKKKVQVLAHLEPFKNE